MKRILLAAVGLTVIGTLYRAYPDESARFVAFAVDAARSAWDGVGANPVPIALAGITFLLTAAYHKARGKSLRESVEVAATRVTVVPVPTPVPAEPESPVIARAKARTTRTQLIADQIGLQNRCRKLPEAINRAEQEACYTEQGVTDAEWKLAQRRKAHDEAVAKLDELRKERTAADAELAAIDAELKRLADVV